MLTLSAQIVSADVTPNDALYDRQGYLRQIHIPEAWSITTGSAKTVIAIIDSGLDIDHPEFQDAIWTNSDEIPGDGIDNDGNGYVDDIHGWDFVNNIPDPNAKFGGDFSVAGINHGTLIGGIIAARGNNSFGISGISWQGRLMPLRVLNNQGEGNVFAVVQAIDYAINKRAQIINLSFTSDTDSSFLHAAIQRALRAGISVVIAAVNDDTEQHGFDLSQKPVYP
ncbi:MAG: S8 family serine peptidase, partial [Patescibacteria group bacterium]